MSRILVRLMPALSRPELRDGARRYSRAFIGSSRRGTGQLRQVAPLESQFDRLGEVNAFRRDTWERLHRLAKDRPEVGQTLDEGPIGAALGFETRHNALTLVDRVPLQPMRDFVTAHLRQDGGLTVELTEVDPILADINASVGGLRDAYADNLVTINRAEQRARDARGPFPRPSTVRSPGDRAGPDGVARAAEESALAKAT